MVNPPKLIYSGIGGYKKEPLLSIVMPVFNQELRVASNITSVLKNIDVPAELIVINDASNDNTLTVLVNFLSGLDCSKNISKISLYSFENAAFETACDYFGIHISAAAYVLEVQADMYINEYAFDRKMLEAIKKYPDILMLSGRGTERLLPIHKQYIKGLGTDRGSGRNLLQHLMIRILKKLGIFNTIISMFQLGGSPVSSSIIKGAELENTICPNLASFEKTGLAGRLGPLIEAKIESFTPSHRIYLGETAMRGPLMIDKKKYLEVGGLDSNRFFQGYDDHDLAIRAWDLSGYRCGYIPIRFDSPLEAGTTRKGRTLKQEAEILKNLWRIQYKWKNSSLYRAQDILSKKPLQPEIRNI
jgi:glycosyltransferase involved in cell wall biosynthesis